MTGDELYRLRQRILDNIDTFIVRTTTPAPFSLKRDHTLRVATRICSLARTLNLSDDQIALAEAIALLHDLGRFRQFEAYGTFQDRVSENHAEMALEDIAALGLLEGFTEREQSLITDGVRFHNAAEIPLDRDPEGILFMKLIRDADKLDIWRVLTEHYLSPEPEQTGYISYGLVGNSGFSSQAVKAIFSSTYVKSTMVKSLADLKLMQMSWVFDLNFTQSIATVRQNGYIKAIASSLPVSETLSGICDHINTYMETHGAHETITNSP